MTQIGAFPPETPPAPRGIPQGIPPEDYETTSSSGRHVRKTLAVLMCLILLAALLVGLTTA